MELQQPAYKQWITDLKNRIRSAQIKAALQVNTTLLTLYWELGGEIVAKEAEKGWGDKLIPQLSKDLLHAFPEIKGFSRTNLFYIKKWYLFYNGKATIVPQAVGQLTGDELMRRVISIPWGHNREIITKCKDVSEALFYVAKTAENGWSRNVLVHQMESGLYRRQGSAVTNFDATLPQPQSDLAKELLKDPYHFDFLSLGEAYKERDLERALVDHITRFLLELGTGFSFVGRQFPLNVGGEDFYIDLLFYHLKLRCFVVVELKTGRFMPEWAGKLNFYLSVVDDTLRHEADAPSIGMLVCRERNKVVAEYALRGMAKPMGISEYQLTETIPAELEGSLPTTGALEAELSQPELD